MGNFLLALLLFTITAVVFVADVLFAVWIVTKGHRKQPKQRNVHRDHDTYEPVPEMVGAFTGLDGHVKAFVNIMIVLITVEGGTVYWTLKQLGIGEL